MKTIEGCKYTTNEAFEIYTNASATHNYIIGCEIKGNIYYGFFKDTDLTENLTFTTNSKDEIVLRLLVSRGLKDAVKAQNRLLCDIDTFDMFALQCGKDGTKNRGVAFEMLIHMENNQTYTKDSIPFTEKGDININGVEYQIKFHKGTFTTYDTLLTLE